MNLEQVIFLRLRGAATPEEVEDHLAHFLSSGFYVLTDGSLLSGRQIVDVVGRVKIEIYSREHAPPHFHVVAPDIDAVFDINTCKLLKGKIPKREKDLVVYWHSRAKDDLIRVWNATRPFNCPVGPVRGNAI